MKEESDILINKAEEDYKTAFLTFENEMYNVSCFHSQQTAEKYIKAILRDRDLHYKNDHDIKHLLTMLSSYLPIPLDVLNVSGLLTPFAVNIRHENRIASLELADEALKCATLVREWAIQILKT